MVDQIKAWHSVALSFQHGIVTPPFCMKAWVFIGKWFRCQIQSHSSASTAASSTRRWKSCTEHLGLSWSKCRLWSRCPGWRWRPAAAQLGNWVVAVPVQLCWIVYWQSSGENQNSGPYGLLPPFLCSGWTVAWNDLQGHPPQSTHPS